jgi:hypothetical protein
MVSREFFREEFKRHLPAQTRIVGFIDDPHAAAAELLENPIM